MTLLELLATLAIGVMLAVAGVPALQAFAQQQRALATMGGLVAELANARMAAITHRRPVVVCPTSDSIGCAGDSDWSSGWITFFDSDNDRLPDRPGDVVAVAQASAGSRLRILTSSGRPRVRYLPDGSSAGSNATFELCRADGSPLGAVIINNAGRVRTERREHGAGCTD